MNITPQIISPCETEPAKEQLWREHARRQKESSLSRVAYCREHQLSYAQFGYWERKWRQETTCSKCVLPIKLRDFLFSDQITHF